MLTTRPQNGVARATQDTMDVRPAHSLLPRRRSSGSTARGHGLKLPQLQFGTASDDFLPRVHGYSCIPRHLQSTRRALVPLELLAAIWGRQYKLTSNMRWRFPLRGERAPNGAPSRGGDASLTSAAPSRTAEPCPPRRQRALWCGLAPHFCLSESVVASCRLRRGIASAWLRPLKPFRGGALLRRLGWKEPGPTRDVARDLSPRRSLAVLHPQLGEPKFPRTR